MTRTNLELDDDLVERAMRHYRLPSKRAAVAFALERLVGSSLTLEEILGLEGSGWESSLADLRPGESAADL